MACCLYFFSGDPIENDPKANRANRFQISMMDGLFQNQPWCCATYFCAPCSAYYTRYRVLDGDMKKYLCCQGYINCFCFRGGAVGEQSCPEFCLAVESCLCLGLGMSSSRMVVMDTYDLRPDPCDNRLIRFSNCLQILSCVCHIMAIFIRELKHMVHLIDVISHITFYTLMGCMAAQVNYEIDYQRMNSSTSSISNLQNNKECILNPNENDNDSIMITQSPLQAKILDVEVTPVKSMGSTSNKYAVL